MQDEHTRNDGESLSRVIRHPIKGKEAEEAKQRLPQLQSEMSARVRAAGLTEEQLQQIIDGKAENSNRQ